MCEDEEIIMEFKDKIKNKFGLLYGKLEERVIISKKFSYNFFGVVDMNLHVPGFEVVYDGRKCSKNRKVFAYTPKLLKHCVRNLTDEAKMEEAEYIDDFKRKCMRNAKKSIIPTEKWQKTIDELVDYLKEYSEDKKNSEDQDLSK